MMYHIPSMLSPQDITHFHEQLEQAKWVDGHVTTSTQGAQVKNNQQVNTHSTLYTTLQNEVLNTVNQHALFFATALPRTLSTPLFNHYQNNETYGFHVDGTVHSHPQNSWMHTDLSATLFLSNPQSYNSSKLVINDTFRQHQVKLPAGNLMLYPSSSLHCMTPITHSIQVASFMWIQSMIHDDKKHAMLFELDNNIQSLKSHYSKSEEILSLLNLYHNLLQEWSEI